jgi:hypothetical protein
VSTKAVGLQQAWWAGKRQQVIIAPTRDRNPNTVSTSAAKLRGDHRPYEGLQLTEVHDGHTVGLW